MTRFGFMHRLGEVLGRVMRAHAGEFRTGSSGRLRLVREVLALDLVAGEALQGNEHLAPRGGVPWRHQEFAPSRHAALGMKLLHRVGMVGVVDLLKRETAVLE